MDCLNEIEDPRRPSNGTLHDFREMLVMSIAAVLSDSDTVEDIAYWAQSREAWLRRFLVLKNGVPSEDTFLRLFRALDPKQFEACFRRWVGGVVTALGAHLAIDGKTVRGSASAGEQAIHMVSAFATELGLVLAQEKVANKSNEITAIPELVSALHLKGFLVSIDAIGCQKAIAEQIVTRGGHYVLAVKGNQPGLLQAIQDAFIDRDAQAPCYECSEKSHGRFVCQISSVLPATGIVDPARWPSCRAVAQIVSVRKQGEKAARLEQRYYICSKEISPEELARAVRSHWGIENRLHWVLDVTMGEDASTVRKDNAPQNLSLLKKMALNLIRMDTTDRTVKCSMRLKRKRAAWDDNVRMNMLGLKPL